MTYPRCHIDGTSLAPRPGLGLLDLDALAGSRKHALCGNCAERLLLTSGRLSAVAITCPAPPAAPPAAPRAPRTLVPGVTQSGSSVRSGGHVLLGCVPPPTLTDHGAIPNAPGQGVEPCGCGSQRSRGRRRDSRQAPPGTPVTYPGRAPATCRHASSVPGATPMHDRHASRRSRSTFPRMPAPWARRRPAGSWQLRSGVVQQGQRIGHHAAMQPEHLDSSRLGGIVKTCGLACHDEVARSVAGRGRSCRSDQEPSLTIRSVVGTQPVTNG
jgi:hypothetical protein